MPKKHTTVIKASQHPTDLLNPEELAAFSFTTVFSSAQKPKATAIKAAASPGGGATALPPYPSSLFDPPPVPAPSLEAAIQESFAYELERVTPTYQAAFPDLVSLMTKLQSDVLPILPQILGRPQAQPEALPNPRNAELAKLKTELEAMVAKYQAEIHAWEEAAAQRQSSSLSHTPLPPLIVPRTEQEELDAAHLQAMDRAARAGPEMVQKMGLLHQELVEVETTVDKTLKSLSTLVDELTVHVHMANQPKALINDLVHARDDDE